jgi:hypothetical protein
LSADEAGVPGPAETPVFPVESETTYLKWYQSQQDLYKDSPVTEAGETEEVQRTGIPAEPQPAYTEPDIDMSSAIVFYFHDSYYEGNQREWDDQWSNNTVLPQGEFMDLYPPTSPAAARTLLSLLKTLYCYSDPPIEARFHPGSFVLTLWIGNPTGRIDIDVEAQLAIVQADGKKPVIVATGTKKCKTFSPGPAPFDILLNTKDQVMLRNHRLRISINLIDAQLDLPFLYWDSPDMGSSKLVVPASGPTLLKLNSESRNLTPDSYILQTD